jgi:hypothetical protein
VYARELKRLKAFSRGTGILTTVPCVRAGVTAGDHHFNVEGRIDINVVYSFDKDNDVAAQIVFCQISAAASEASMSMTAYLGDFDANPEIKRILGVALEMTRVSLGLTDGFADGIIAKRIVERAKAGERNPDLLCQGTLEELRGHLYGD